MVESAFVELPFLIGADRFQNVAELDDASPQHEGTPKTLEELLSATHQEEAREKEH